MSKEKGLNVLNLNRDYNKNSYIFLGEPSGLYDTIHIHHPRIQFLLDAARSQQWNEHEFDFTPCLKDFKNKDDNADVMLDTIGSQWEMDSSVANALLPLFAPFITNSEATAVFAFNTSMEATHAASYSEIVRTGYAEPEEALKKIVASQETFQRFSSVVNALDNLAKAGIQYTLGNLSKEEVFPILYKGMTAVYLLERINFIASFAITFGLGEMGLFLPIANCVKKICSDEINIHSNVDEYCLRHMREDMHYWQDWKDNKEFQQEIIELIDGTEKDEENWTDFIFKDRTIVGLTPELVKDWVRFNVQMLKQSMDLPFEVKVKENPLPWMNNWLSLNKFQNAPQEIEKSDYAVGAMRDDLDDGEDFDV